MDAIRDSAPTRSWTTRAALLLVVACGFAVRAALVVGRPLWFDEAFTWRMAPLGPAQIVQHISLDSHPPLYFFLLAGWTRALGNSPAAIRSLSVVLGCATIVAVYAMTVEALRSFGRADQKDPARARDAGLLAAAFCAFQPLQIFWGGNARMYALATALAATSTWALFRAMRPDEPPRARRWATYGVAALMLAYTHYFAFATLAAHALFVAAVVLTRARFQPAVAARDPALRRALVTAAVVAAAWLPWASHFLAQRAQVSRSWWMPPLTPFDALRLWGALLVTITPRGPVLAAVFAAAVTLLLVGLWRRGSAADRYFALSAALPWVAGVLMSLAGTATLSVNYLALAQLSICAGLGALLARVGSPAVRRGTIAALVALGLFVGLRTRASLMSRPGGDIPGVAAYLSAVRQPGEPVLVGSLEYVPLTFYMRDDDAVMLWVPSGGLQLWMGVAVLTPRDRVVTDAASVASPGGRVFVVGVLPAGGYRRDPVPSEWVALPALTRTFPRATPRGSIVVNAYAIPSSGAAGAPAR